MRHVFIQYTFVLISLHILVILMEFMYRYFCFSLDSIHATLLSIITRNSSVCITLHETIDTVDNILKDKLIHIISSFVLLYIKN